MQVGYQCIFGGVIFTKCLPRVFSALPVLDRLFATAVSGMKITFVVANPGGMQRAPTSVAMFSDSVENCGYAVWAYHRFCLSFRDVEDLLAERGIIVSYETIRQWCEKFGPAYARKLKRREGRLGDHWHLDEVSFGLMANSSICGVPWIRMVT